VVVRRHRPNPDAREGANRAAAALALVVAQVLYRGRVEARRASHEALRRELALARDLGAGPIPEPALIVDDAHDRARARAAGRAYAQAWLKAAIDALEAAG
jgi:hypothetical protein